MPALEPLFHALALDLVVPPTGDVPAPPGDTRDADALRSWWDGVEGLETRDTAFLDEKLLYAVSLSIPHTTLPDADSPPAELTALTRALHLTATASFLPPVNFQSSQPSSTTTTPVRASLPGSAGLAPPTAGSGRPVSMIHEDGQAPMTPQPFPGTQSGEERYAAVEGVTVWEGGVECEDGKWGVFERGAVVRGEHAWRVVWMGELPVVYVRTQISNPVLALTVSATLREKSVRPRRRSGTVGGDNASIRSVTTMQTEDFVEEEEEEAEEEQVDLAGMEEIDLLGGLAPDAMPASRLSPSLCDDLSIRTPTYTARSGNPGKATSPQPLPSTTLRKSFRRVLTLSPGLRVRMRTLFLPQLLPPGVDFAGDDDTEPAERRIVLSVEVENFADHREHGFEVQSVVVDVGGKGPKASAELVCAPDTSIKNDPATTPPSAAFPVRLGALEQYNLLYSVTITSATAEPARKAEEHRPVSIILSGRPYRRTAAGESIPTAPFQSRWNCALDLAPYYASLPPAAPPVHHQAAAPRFNAHRMSKPAPPSPNAIVGDKRYALASLLNTDHSRDQSRTPGPPHMPDRRYVSQPARPFPPSQNNRVMSTRAPPSVPTSTGHDGHGLLVSVKLLAGDAAGPGLSGVNTSGVPGGTGAAGVEAAPNHSLSATTISSKDDTGGAWGAGPAIKPLDTFSIEVFVHNRTDSVRRFRLGIPPRDPLDGMIRDTWARRRRRDTGEAQYGVDDTVLTALLASHEAASPALVPLETDVRCGPLLPGASLAARIRFLALREGVHTIERLRLTGVGDEFDFVIAPVLEVVVGE